VIWHDAAAHAAALGSNQARLPSPCFFAHMAGRLKTKGD
jgi:hypothetical protein